MFCEANSHEAIYSFKIRLGSIREIQSITRLSYDTSSLIRNDISNSRRLPKHVNSYYLSISQLNCFISDSLLYYNTRLALRLLILTTIEVFISFFWHFFRHSVKVYRSLFFLHFFTALKYRLFREGGSVTSTLYIFLYYSLPLSPTSVVYYNWSLLGLSDLYNQP